MNHNCFIKAIDEMRQQWTHDNQWQLARNQAMFLFRFPSTPPPKAMLKGDDLKPVSVSKNEMECNTPRLWLENFGKHSATGGSSYNFIFQRISLSISTAATDIEMKTTVTTSRLNTVNELISATSCKLNTHHKTDMRNIPYNCNI
jgi:hypothetical protein